MSVKKQVKRITVCLATFSVMSEKQYYWVKLSNIFVGGKAESFIQRHLQTRAKKKKKNAKCRMDWKMKNQSLFNHYSTIKKQQKQQNEKYEIKLFYGGPSLPIKKYFFSFVSK